MPEDVDRLLKTMDANLEAILKKTMKMDDPDDQMLAVDVRNFFQTQFSSETVEGTIVDLQFKPVLFDVVMALHELIYIKHFSHKLEDRDVLMSECRVLAVFMLSKIYNGRFYNLRIEDIRSRQQISNNFLGPAR